MVKVKQKAMFWQNNSRYCLRITSSKILPDYQAK
jgi:hypothetical protein